MKELKIEGLFYLSIFEQYVIYHNVILLTLNSLIIITIGILAVHGHLLLTKDIIREGMKNL